MRKWLTPIAAAALSAALVAPTLAGAASDRKCSFNLTDLTAPVKVSGTPPMAGAVERRAARVDGKLCGKPFHGAGRVTIDFAGPGKPSTVVAPTFGPLGSLLTTGTALGVPQPDGSVKISGSGKITGGTGLYKGARGSFSTTGTRAANSNVNVIHIRGKVRF